MVTCRSSLFPEQELTQGFGRILSPLVNFKPDAEKVSLCVSPLQLQLVFKRGGDSQNHPCSIVWAHMMWANASSRLELGEVTTSAREFDISMPTWHPYFLRASTINQWKSFPLGIVGAPSLEIFKKRLGLSGMVPGLLSGVAGWTRRPPRSLPGPTTRLNACRDSFNNPGKEGGQTGQNPLDRFLSRNFGLNYGRKSRTALELSPLPGFAEGESLDLPEPERLLIAFSVLEENLHLSSLSLGVLIFLLLLPPTLGQCLLYWLDHTSTRTPRRHTSASSLSLLSFLLPPPWHLRALYERDWKKKERQPIEWFLLIFSIRFPLFSPIAVKPLSHPLTWFKSGTTTAFKRILSGMETQIKGILQAWHKQARQQSNSVCPGRAQFRSGEESVSITFSSSFTEFLKYGAWVPIPHASIHGMVDFKMLSSFRVFWDV
ncbi:hypothetical protein L345_05470, partial [Ophiophagus hannah]